MTISRAFDADAVLDLMVEEAMIDRALLFRETALADAGIPSMEFINILFAIEDRFGVVIQPNEFKEYITVGDMVDAVVARQSSAGDHG